MRGLDLDRLRLAHESLRVYRVISLDRIPLEEYVCFQDCVTSLTATQQEQWALVSPQQLLSLSRAAMTRGRRHRDAFVFYTVVFVQWGTF